VPPSGVEAPPRAVEAQGAVYAALAQEKAPAGTCLTTGGGITGREARLWHFLLSARLDEKLKKKRCGAKAAGRACHPRGTTPPGSQDAAAGGQEQAGEDRQRDATRQG
jgi:hypothetical protein